MNDADCSALLQWALPRLGLRWPGFRRFRRQVCRRIEDRIRALGIEDAGAYRRHLETHAAEWSALAPLCTVTISRFARDRAVFESLACAVLPALAQAALARGAGRLECWSAGCASGEEPYSVAIQWKLALAERFPGLALRVLGTDVDPALIARANAACYKASSLRELPSAWRAAAFAPAGDSNCVRPAFRAGVEFECRDLLAEPPAGDFDLVLCRNVAFTYFGEALARRALERIASRLRVGGALVIGLHERLPASDARLEAWPGCRAIFRHVEAARP